MWASRWEVLDPQPTRRRQKRGPQGRDKMGLGSEQLVRARLSLNE